MLPDGHAGAAGGALTHVLEVVNALQALGVDAVATTIDDAPGDADVVHQYVLGHLEHQAEAARAKWPTARFALTPIFVPWDLRHVMAASDRSVTIAAAKNVVKNRLFWFRCRAIVQHADAVFPCSSAEARLISRFYRVSMGSHWHVAPTGVHVRDWPAVERPPRDERAKALGLSRDCDLLVVCSGRLEPRKNQRALVRAVASLPRAGLALLGAKDKQPYADDTVALGVELLGDRFHWFGEVTRDEVRDALAAADVFALCSVREMASLAVHEAAAMGCEVVTTRAGPTEEYYDDLAHLCSPSVNGIATAIGHAASHPRQPALRERVVDAFDWSVSARAIASAYGQLDRSAAR